MSAEADQVRGLGATASAVAIHRDEKRHCRMCMVSYVSSFRIGFVKVRL